MSKILNRILGITIVIVAVSLFFFAAFFFWKKEISCYLNGGNIVEYGQYSKRCVIETSDSGKPCNDSSECESSCVIYSKNLSSEQKGEIDYSENDVYMMGECGNKGDSVECGYSVENGKVNSSEFCPST